MGKLKWVVGAVAALGGAAWIGLKVPPKPFELPDDPGRDLGTLTLPGDLPAPVYRYYRAVALFPRVESAYASGRGRFAVVEQPLKVWVPVRWQAYMEPGRQFHWRTDLTWFGQKIIQGVDEIVGGEARLTVGRQTLTGDAIHKTEHTILWLYTLAFCPTALLTLPDVRWEAVDDVTARLHFPSLDPGEPPFTLHFEPASSALARVVTQRFHPELGVFRPYQATFDVRRSMGGTSLSKSISAAWDDDFYVDVDLEYVHYNVELPFPPEASGEG